MLFLVLRTLDMMCGLLAILRAFGVRGMDLGMGLRNGPTGPSAPFENVQTLV